MGRPFFLHPGPFTLALMTTLSSDYWCLPVLVAKIGHFLNLSKLTNLSNCPVVEHLLFDFEEDVDLFVPFPDISLTRHTLLKYNRYRARAVFSPPQFDFILKSVSWIFDVEDIPLFLF